ncbi:MAG: 2-amino-4-hydroxy-6-hydroxymethyldihydropteridine diphosphokinase [Clostridia bacterium]|nr:2-amino-4-hydroxy-6-hydroxymethyldihydropteridine diphosphokinase [Clostridia bacterium]
MVKAFLSLGSNKGDKKEYLTKAINLIAQHRQIKLIKTASFYQTNPVGYLEQDLFLNTVIEVETGLKPRELLKEINEIEQQLGRDRNIRWGPRTVDIDILTYDQEMIDEEDLTIPHREMKKRGFVLIPLLEIAPDFSFPSGEEGKEILYNLSEEKGCLGVEKVI